MGKINITVKYDTCYNRPGHKFWIHLVRGIKNTLTSTKYLLTTYKGSDTVLSIIPNYYIKSLFTALENCLKLNDAMKAARNMLECHK